MRTFIRTLALVAMLCLFAGCGKSEPPAKADLRTRLEAAKQISNPTDRDSALNAVAGASADIGAGDIVIESLGQISNPTLHDQTAGDSALRLARVKQVSAAKDVAQTISNPTLRDATLKKLAEGV